MPAPIGNQNAVKAKRWQQAIDRALEKRSKKEGIDELDRLAEKFLDTVEDLTFGTEKRAPSIAGFQELGDRLDGRSSQTVELGATPAFVEAISSLGAFMAKAIGEGEVEHHEGVGAGGLVLPPEIPPTAH